MAKTIRTSPVNRLRLPEQLERVVSATIEQGTIKQTKGRWQTLADWKRIRADRRLIDGKSIKELINDKGPGEYFKDEEALSKFIEENLL